MAYATVSDIESRIVNELSTAQSTVCTNLLNDAAVIIDNYNSNASTDAKKLVSCRMVIRAVGSSDVDSAPIGATQGSMSALGYVQSWTMQNSGTVGELYLSKLDKQLLGGGGSIGASNPLDALCGGADE